eukprot:14368719-Ditylum_brightwellii.AAC.1
MGTVNPQMREALRMNLPRHSEGQSVALTCLETSIGFLHTVSNFICDTYCDLEAAGFPLNTTWIQNHPSVVGTYVTFLVANLETGKSDKLTANVAALKADVRVVTAEVKATKATVSSAMTKEDKF